MNIRWHLRSLLYRAFGFLPKPLRILSARWGTPNYTLGASCRVIDDDDRVLLVLPTYRKEWTFPGGLMDRGEAPADAAIRECGEETGIRPVITGQPISVVHPGLKRVEFIYPARLPEGVVPEAAKPNSPEIRRVQWFAEGAAERFDPRTTVSEAEIEGMHGGVVAVPPERWAVRDEI